MRKNTEYSSRVKVDPAMENDGKYFNDYDKVIFTLKVQEHLKRCVYIRGNKKCIWMFKDVSGR